jgi:hypothetical protein
MDFRFKRPAGIQEPLDAGFQLARFALQLFERGKKRLLVDPPVGIEEFSQLVHLVGQPLDAVADLLDRGLALPAPPGYQPVRSQDNDHVGCQDD